MKPLEDTLSTLRRTHFRLFVASVAVLVAAVPGPDNDASAEEICLLTADRAAQTLRYVDPLLRCEGAHDQVEVLPRPGRSTSAAVRASRTISTALVITE